MKYAALVGGDSIAAVSALVAGRKRAGRRRLVAGEGLQLTIPDRRRSSEYTPLPKASKPWNICVLFPHMKDTFWVAVDYGVVEEAKRMGVNMTLYQAGGYENLPKQLSQFDDCMAGNFDAIIVGPISEAGLDKKFAEGVKAGKVIISTVNPVSKSTVTSKMTVDFTTMGVQTGTYLVDFLKDKTANVGTFPGPSGSGWAEAFLDGFKKAIKGKSNIKDARRQVRRFGRRGAVRPDPERASGVSGHERYLGLRAGGRSRDRSGGPGGKEGRADHVVLRESGDARRAEQRRDPRFRDPVPGAAGPHRDRHGGARARTAGIREEPDGDPGHDRARAIWTRSIWASCSPRRTSRRSIR